MSVDNIVAETPRLLAKGLQQTGLAQSGKLVVVKVSVLFYFLSSSFGKVKMRPGGVGGTPWGA